MATKRTTIKRGEYGPLKSAAKKASKKTSKKASKKTSRRR